MPDGLRMLHIEVGGAGFSRGRYPDGTDWYIVTPEEVQGNVAEPRRIPNIASSEAVDVNRTHITVWVQDRRPCVQFATVGRYPN